MVCTHSIVSKRRSIIEQIQPKTDNFQEIVELFVPISYVKKLKRNWLSRKLLHFDFPYPNTNKIYDLITPYTLRPSYTTEYEICQLNYER